MKTGYPLIDAITDYLETQGHPAPDAWKAGMPSDTNMAMEEVQRHHINNQLRRFIGADAEHDDIRIRAQLLPQGSCVLDNWKQLVHTYVLPHLLKMVGIIVEVPETAAVDSEFEPVYGDAEVLTDPVLSEAIDEADDDELKEELGEVDDGEDDLGAGDPDTWGSEPPAVDESGDANTGRLVYMYTTDEDGNLVNSKTPESQVSEEVVEPKTYARGESPVIQAVDEAGYANTESN